MRNIIARFVSFVAFIRSYTDPVVDAISSNTIRLIKSVNQTRMDVLWMNVSVLCINSNLHRIYNLFNEGRYGVMSLTFISLSFWIWQFSKTYNMIGEKEVEKIEPEEKSNIIEIEQFLKNKNLK